MCEFAESIDYEMQNITELNLGSATNILFLFMIFTEIDKLPERAEDYV